MSADTDPRTTALLTLATRPEQHALVAGLLHVLETLEQTDFGELEPVGVAAPHWT